MHRKLRVGIFISQYDAGGSHTRSFVKCLAERDIFVDIFLCNPMGYKDVDTFSYGIDMVNVYYFKRDWNFKNRSDHLIIKSYKWFYALIISFYQKLIALIIRIGFIIGLKNEYFLIPLWVQKETNRIINKKKYNSFFGIEAQGLVYAGIMGKKYQVPYIYHSYELFTKKFPNGEGREFLKKFYLLKYLEKKYHIDAVATIIQDKERKKILYKENSINGIPAFYMPVSLKGQPKYCKGKYFHQLFNIEPSLKIVLQYGSIYDQRYASGINKIIENLPENYVLVMHGRYKKEFINSLKNHANSDKLFISTKLVEPDYISEIISSAHIGLSFYKTNDPNFSLSGLSSHKLAHYTQCGLPIVSNNYPSISSLIDELEFGICVNSIIEISDAIKKIDSNYYYYNQNSFKAYSKYYYIDNYMNQVIQLIS